MSFPYKTIYFSEKNSTKIKKIFFNRRNCNRKNVIDDKEYKKFIKEMLPNVREKELKVFTFHCINENIFQTDFNSYFDGNQENNENNPENAIFIKEFSNNELKELQNPILFFLNVYYRNICCGFTYFIGDFTTTFKDAYLEVYKMLHKINESQQKEIEKQFMTQFVGNYNKIIIKESHFLLYLKAEQGSSNILQELDYNTHKFKICENSNIITLIVEIKENSLIKNLNLADPLDIKDLLEFFFKKEKMEDKLCEICKEPQIIKKTGIQVYPNICILMLDRFNQEISQDCFSKNQTSLILNHEIDLSNYVKCPELNFDMRKIEYKMIANDENQKGEQKIVYELFAVCQHKGIDISLGHYISFCKSYLDQKWRKYDDKNIEEIDDIQKLVHNNKEAYMLFYIKKN